VGAAFIAAGFVWRYGLVRRSRTAEDPLSSAEASSDKVDPS